MVVLGGIKRQMVLSRIPTIKGHEQIMKQGYDDVIAVGKRMVEFFFYPHKQTLVRIGIDVEITPHSVLLKGTCVSYWGVTL